MYEEGQEIYDLAKEMFPICRSITGEGVRQTLAILSKYIGDEGPSRFRNVAVPSGRQVFDWTVPKEWSIKEAYIEDESGSRIVDFADNNLHVMGYSIPVDADMELEELLPHIYTQQDQPDVIPYVTSYYTERWGFCMTDKAKKALKPGKYHVHIDSKLFDGVLNYGEVIVPGQTEKEIFFSTYVCHPSMANNECSGPALTAKLIKYVRSLPKRKYTYRFIFIPETIGSITYLAYNLDKLKKDMVAGFVLSCVGDDRAYSYLSTRYGNTFADRVLKKTLAEHGEYKEYSYLKRGSDERQYNAPGVDLPVAVFCRSKYAEYPEYHTSADNMDLVSPKGFQGSFDVMSQLITNIEYNVRYKTQVLCEPQLGKRGLYPTVSQKGSYESIYAMRDLIAYSDGSNDLIEVSNIIGVPVKELIPIVDKLLAARLIKAEPIC